jgi:hypothetical protein
MESVNRANEAITEVVDRRDNVPSTILRQLGGGKFITMTGANCFTGGAGFLTFKIPSNKTKDRISHVRILLDYDDTYSMTFFACRGSVVKTIASHNGIYCDQLQEIFTDITGLQTHL